MLFIENTILSIFNQKISNAKYEIIVVDGMSNDGTREIIQRLISTINAIQIVDNPDKIVSTGFNLGLSKAKGDIIIRVDGHSKLESNFLINTINLFNKIDAECIGGPTKHIAKGIVGKSISIAQTLKFGVGNALFRQKIKKGSYVDTLAFGAYKREVFKKIGGYDEELLRNQDDEFNFRLIQFGGRIWLDPSIKSFYYPRTSLKKLFSQYFQYGLYKIRVIQKRKALASFRQIIPFLFVFVLIVTALLWLINSNFYFLLVCLLICYFSLGIFFTLSALLKRKRDYLSILILPITFFTMHCAYGFGFMIGLIYFFNKWHDVQIKDSQFKKSEFA